MGVTKKILKEGNGVDKPVKGDDIVMNYRGCLYDSSKPSEHFMGRKFDSTEERGEFKTKIGIGVVIRGWDEAVLQMSLGEKSILTITDDYAYGARGFPGLIPPHATLVFEVELKGINSKRV
ncbi:FK506-binding protein/peptidyl-prolyl cis-trans isomerase, putative [Coccidioides posadasii C735 delta SOWgp]|uniref:peptidylprolyl isomerase n=1 Tax=Coccidioides posadasii (strain C735) TaxID=222929 RepID=C5P3X4_COCP7|nr:FK506-binding protein/peptidyl-prolyl cis-trans isomerase, putative [Coccidioides posadasii C735 delta SOWgp]EER28392.1 FK506-binding protein/peptidyl-prolyl cis-trans isomerase, putative [Coccidioides posadasii C735 delta SOWgp]|eukprot:XP_003070537.1 FK506-binding protein/peptidyl-prolyl cis-trans isomerase, putative [Coccidioides posadasii C735 delta SOWgp]